MAVSDVVTSVDPAAIAAAAATSRASSRRMRSCSRMIPNDSGAKRKQLLADVEVAADRLHRRPAVVVTLNAFEASSAFSNAWTPTPVARFASTTCGLENPNPWPAWMSR